MPVPAEPRVYWWPAGRRDGWRMRITGRNGAGKIRAVRLNSDGTETTIVRFFPAHEFKCPHDGGVDTLNRLFAEAPLIGKGSDPGPPQLGGTRRDTTTGQLFGAAR
ncbi:hypothetical protein FHP25_36035 [Vineibacter terrae]|uniref:Uncharacterized protein n=1 Tax=Vineibacter terrae TaxID=2586908 RepID=A0A5C8PAS3_9HYPH|nr:hypothetical protein [Vineibacter terrae]TXL70135.1 hypothetical protein FHP25_36035 [Vineibacter terrae]